MIHVAPTYRPVLFRWGESPGCVPITDARRLRSRGRIGIIAAITAPQINCRQSLGKIMALIVSGEKQMSPGAAESIMPNIRC